MSIIPCYPDTCAVTIELRNQLHERLRSLLDGVSEFTFANLYLFRHTHQYRLSMLHDDDTAVIVGKDADTPFFMLPFGLPDAGMLAQLFAEHTTMKCVTGRQKDQLEKLGYAVDEDRDNYDYLYKRTDLAALAGRKFSKKRNLVNAFINNYEYTGKPLLEEHIPEALDILEQWREEHGEGDYYPAREALEKAWDLQLCGGIYYVDNRPAGYSLGEELKNSTSFVIHFEKALPGYKGLYQFINKSFAAILPDLYDTINREQDLGDEGLRQAKHSYQPSGFVVKYRARKTKS